MNTRNSPSLRKEWRADDWKKAYVLFHPPPGMDPPPPAAAATATDATDQEGPMSRGMVDQLLEAKGVHA